MNHLSFKKLHPDAKLPTRAHPTDAGLDLYCVEEFGVEPNTVSKGSTGLSVAIPAGYVGYVKPKSGLALQSGVDVLAGVIDSGYTGEVIVLLTALHSCYFHKGQKIAQLVVERIETPEAVWGDGLEDQTPSLKEVHAAARTLLGQTSKETLRQIAAYEDQVDLAVLRGTGGFGSTGK